MEKIIFVSVNREKKIETFTSLSRDKITNFTSRLKKNRNFRQIVVEKSRISSIGCRKKRTFYVGREKNRELRQTISETNENFVERSLNKIANFVQ